MLGAPTRHDGGSSGGYRRRLKRVGRYLDAHGFHALTIVELEDGLLVRVCRAGSRAPEIIEIVDDGILPAEAPAPEPAQVRRRLFPGGYAPFLEALGERLDQAGAAAVSIVEGTDFVVVGGIQLVSDGPEGRAYEPLDILLLASDIQALLVRSAHEPLARARHRTPADREASEAAMPANSRPEPITHANGMGDVLQRFSESLRSPISWTRGHRAPGPRTN